MTDKQIIINGIDVSGCEYRDWQNSCHCDNSKENEGEKRVTGRGGCKYNPNCHYKQLKRKEQELEEVCKAFDIEYVIDKETGDLFGRCNKLCKKEQECEELKKTIMYKCPQCGEECLSPIGASLYEENNKLKQTLTEIKEIAEKDFNHTCWETYARQLKQILQKIK